jgi:uncharacterized protein (DUF3084 family)
MSPQRVVGFIQRNLPACVVAVIVVSALAMASALAWTAAQVGNIRKDLVAGRIRINASVSEAERARIEAELARQESEAIRKQLESDVDYNRRVAEKNRGNVNELYDWVKFIYDNQKKVADKVDNKLDHDVKP